MDTYRLAAGLLHSPRATLTTIVTRRSVMPALVLASLAAVMVAWVLASRVDWTLALQQRLSGMSQMALEQNQIEAISLQVAAWGRFRLYAGAILGPSIIAICTSAILWAGFRFANAAPSFRETLVVVAWGRLPLALGSILAIPAILSGTRVLPDAASYVLPTSALYFVPAASGPLRAAIASVDLFSFWSLGLISIGMAFVAKTGVMRSAGVTLVLWGAWVALCMAASMFFGANS